MGADATSCCAETIVDLPGFVVLAAGEYGGELEPLVETTATKICCGQCGARAVVHDRREHLLRDVPVAGRDGAGVEACMADPGGEGASGLGRVCWIM